MVLCLLQNLPLRSLPLQIRLLYNPLRSPRLSPLQIRPQNHPRNLLPDPRQIPPQNPLPRIRLLLNPLPQIRPQNLLQTQVVLRVNRQVSLHDRPTITLVQQTLHHQLNPTHKLKIKQQTVEIHHNKVTKYPSTDMDRLVNTPLSNVEECFFTQKQHHQLIQIKKTTRIFLNNSNGLL